MLIHLEKGQDFKSLIQNGVVLVDFFATWCGPCKMLSPELEKLAEKRSDVTVLKVDVDEHGEIAALFNVRAVPTLILFKDGANISQSAGFKPLASLEKFVDTAF